MRLRREVRSVITVLLAAVLFGVVMIGSMKPRTELVASFLISDTSRSSGVVRLLPVVFFDSASSDIPERYDLEPLPNGSSSGHYRTLHDAYLRVLDVLAEQLLTTREYVILQGFEERTNVIDACFLARSRAERVRNYLVYDRGVDPRRIRVLRSNNGCLPLEISARDGERLNCEYRRVEILTPSRDPFPILMRIASTTPALADLNGSCILTFTVRSDYVRRAQREQIAVFLGSVPTGSELSITANADVIGRSESASQIARQRAERVVEYIRKIRPDCRLNIASSFVPRPAPFGLPSQDLPEIRYLCRTVVIRQGSISPQSSR